MKELIPQTDLKDKLHIVTPVKQEYKLIGSIQKIKGLTLYSWKLK